MSAPRIFTANVALNAPGEGIKVFMIGEAVPDWATVGDHASQGVTKAAQTPEKVAPVVVTPPVVEVLTDDEDESYADWTKAVLRTEVDGRQLEVPAKATKDELIAALEADDLENPED